MQHFRHHLFIRLNFNILQIFCPHFRSRKSSRCQDIPRIRKPFPVNHGKLSLRSSAEHKTYPLYHSQVSLDLVGNWWWFLLMPIQGQGLGQPGYISLFPLPAQALGAHPMPCSWPSWKHAAFPVAGRREHCPWSCRRFTSCSTCEITNRNRVFLWIGKAHGHQ